jgi:transmembrane sensor
MKTDPPHSEAESRRTTRPEAAAWLAKLQSPGRTVRTGDAFRIWLGSGQGRDQAFGESTAVWEGLRGAGLEFRHRRRMRVVGMAAAFAAIVTSLAVFSVWQGSQPELVYQTAVGEQRFSILPDGTQVTLNTNSLLKVAFTGRARDVTLVSGEALFDVAKDPAKPFVVHVDDREVRALGTSFVVYKTDDSFAVTLFEGKVSVGPHSDAEQGITASPGVVVLEPGQRWNLKSRTVQQLTPLQLDAATQWRRQEVVFSGTPLPEAVAEMNRYTERPMSITDARLDGRSVSGVFRIGDTESFINTLTALYGVTIVRESPATRP